MPTVSINNKKLTLLSNNQHDAEIKLYTQFTDQKMEPYPEVLEILEIWSKKCEIAVASRTSYPPGAESLLSLFGFEKYIKYKEIYPGCKHAHFKSLKNRSNFEYSEMLFFDDEPRNIRDLRKFGVECVLVDSDIGVTKKLIQQTVDEKFLGAKLC